MPVLFLILADRLGINVTLSTAPLHVFIKVTDAQGRIWNVETTSGANATRDVWYQQKLGFSDKAVANGIYMANLQRGEAAALMADIVVEKLIANRRFQEAADVADQILERSPRDVYVLVKKGTAFAHMLETEFERRYPNPNDIPQSLRPRYLSLVDGNRRAFDTAESWGWTP